jgi:hypothetical protein
VGQLPRHATLQGQCHVIDVNTCVAFSAHLIAGSRGWAQSKFHAPVKLGQHNGALPLHVPVEGPPQVFSCACLADAIESPRKWPMGAWHSLLVLHRYGSTFIAAAQLLNLLRPLTTKPQLSMAGP